MAAVLALFLELGVACHGFMESSYQIKAAFPFSPRCVGNRSRRLSSGQQWSRGYSTSQPAKPPPLEHMPNRLHLPSVAFVVTDDGVGGDLVGRCVGEIHGNGELLRVLHTRGSCGLSLAGGGHEFHHVGDGEGAPIPCGLDDFAASAAAMFDAAQCGGALHLHSGWKHGSGEASSGVRVDRRFLVLRFNIRRSGASPVKLKQDLRLKISNPRRHRLIRQSRRVHQ
ncbi:unnamed protein product [Miscanthus lutarioriparius]|uniref:Uncharacterized protein n=1 Tax=Miscanthus lutarioriparius TaxID=422564 RepID=A0A811Q3N9_9POAL|nr:unnamed protein product [Miscanthus lutarioriparius]